MRKGAKAAVIGSVFTVMVGGAGYGAFNIVSALTEDSGTESVKTGPPSKDEIAETSEKFFATWEKGQAQAAADLTDNAAPAATLIGDYKATAHITGVKITPGRPPEPPEPPCRSR